MHVKPNAGRAISRSNEKIASNAPSDETVNDGLFTLKAISKVNELRAPSIQSAQKRITALT